MLFGDKLKELRLDRGITQKELGNIIGVSDRVVGYYESNDRFPRDESTLKAIADYFNVSVDYLVGRSNIKNPERQEDSLKEEQKDKLFTEIDSLSEESKKELEKYIQLLKIKEEMDKSKDETSSALEKNA